MLIIDKNAELALTKTIEALRTQSGAVMRIIHCALADAVPQGAIAQAQEAVIQSAQQDISAEIHIYLCADGDIFILAANLPVKEAMAAIAHLAVQFTALAAGEWVHLYELKPHAHPLLAMLDAKTEKIRQAQQEAKKYHLLQDTEQKRRSILGGVLADRKAGDIAARRNQRSQPELMIIEDDVFSCRLVQNALDRHYNLTALSTADTAINTYVAKAPDVLFLDINLPDINGHELLAKFIEIDPHAYIIMLSGNADQKNILQAMKNGAKGFIAKPFTRDKLFQYIERCPTLKQAKDKDHANP